MKKADSQYYDLTWEKLEKVFGDNPNWKNEVELYVFLYETMMEKDRDVLNEFEDWIIAYNAQGADRKRFNAFQQMVLKASKPQTIERMDDELPELSEFDLDAPAEEKVIYHKFKNLDELLKYAQQDPIKEEEQDPKFNESSPYSKDVTLQDTSIQNPNEVVIEQTVSEDDSGPGASTAVDYNKKEKELRKL